MHTISKPRSGYVMFFSKTFRDEMVPKVVFKRYAISSNIIRNINMKIYIETLGCAKNMNDSEVAAGILENSGHKITNQIEDAEAIIVNTCGFINDAKKESIERIFDMAALKKEDALLIVSGCLSQRYQDELYTQMPEVDIFLGVNDYVNLPEIIANCSGKNSNSNSGSSNSNNGNSNSNSGSSDSGSSDSDSGSNSNSSSSSNSGSSNSNSGNSSSSSSSNSNRNRQKYFSEYGKEYVEMPERKIEDGVYSATLKIAEGCDNVCTYCVIPSIRGSYRSRKKENILDEAKKLALQGCKELIIVAQDVTSYGIDLYGKYELGSLLRDLCEISGIRWIRLMYCYEDRITDELIETMRTEEKICNYIDIPVQHCNDTILKAMNRRSTKNSIMSTFNKLRAAMPDIHIRTTLITGFPGEGIKEFLELIDFVETVKPERLGVFAYSKEEGTPAAKMKQHVRTATKESRVEAIMLRQLDFSLEHNTSKIGKVLEVIVEEVEHASTSFEDGSADAESVNTDSEVVKNARSELESITYYGRSRYDAPEIDNAVLFTSSKKHEPGDIVNVEIIDAFDYDLVGKVV